MHKERKVILPDDIRRAKAAVRQFYSGDRKSEETIRNVADLYTDRRKEAMLAELKRLKG